MAIQIARVLFRKGNPYFCVALEQGYILGERKFKISETFFERYYPKHRPSKKTNKKISCKAVIEAHKGCMNDTDTSQYSYTLL